VFDMSSLIVGEAVERMRELDALLVDASEIDRQQLMLEAVTDPYYGPAVEAHDSLGQLATGLSNLVRVAETADSTSTEASSVEANPDEFDRIADLDGYDEQREKAARQQATIELTHGLMDAYRDTPGALSSKRTTKQQKDVKRSIAGAYRKSWETAELADDPEQLKTILESLDASSLSQRGKQELTDFVTEKVRDHVSATAEQTDPDALARRLVVALEPSTCTERLTDALIKPYFTAAGMKGVDAVIDTYELFLRAVLRTADHPNIMASAMQIVSLKTAILSNDSLYAHHLHATPQLRLDRPELLGRMTSIGKAIGQIQCHVDGLHGYLDAVEKAAGNTTNQFGMAAEEIDRVLTNNPGQLKQDMARYLRMAKDAKFGMTSAQQGAIAFEEIGMDAYIERTNALKMYHDILLSEGPEQVVTQLLTDGKINNDVSLAHAIDIVMARVLEKYPEQKEFLHALAFTESELQEELPLFIADPTSDLLGMMKSSQSRRLIRSTMAVIDDVDIPGTITDEELDQVTRDSQVTTVPLGDGFVVELIEQRGLPYPTPAEIEKLLDMIGRDRIAQAQTQANQNIGSRRRHEYISTPDIPTPVIVRRENEQDRKDIHPINELVELLAEITADGEADDDISLQSSIEENVNRLATERRRFLNERGIMVDLTDDDSSFTMTVRKHAGNRKAFVVDIALSDKESGASTKARILMDDRLRFRLGNRKVRQQSPLLMLNLLAADLVTHFACQEAVETTEGRIEGNKGLVERIAHLRLLADGQRRSDHRWFKCLEVEGLDLDVLGKQQQDKLNTTRVTTYVEAVESDGEDKGPIVITDLFDA
jgi:hypothetical protein